MSIPRWQRWRYVNLNDYLKLPLRLAFGPILTFIPDADGRIKHIGLTALTDTEGHYTQFVCRLRPR